MLTAYEKEKAHELHATLAPLGGSGEGDGDGGGDDSGGGGGGDAGGEGGGIGGGAVGDGFSGCDGGGDGGEIGIEKAHPVTRGRSSASALVSTVRVITTGSVTGLSPWASGSSVTVAVELPESYWTVTSWSHTLVSFVLLSTPMRCPSISGPYASLTWR